MTHPGGRPRSVDSDSLALARDLKGTGLTWRQVGDLLGMPPGTLSKLAPRIPINSAGATGRTGTGSDTSGRSEAAGTIGGEV
jgi:hypothetical protein